MKPKKKPPQFAKRKKAFDEVMAAYRDAKDVTGGVGAVRGLGEARKSVTRGSGGSM